MKSYLLAASLMLLAGTVKADERSGDRYLTPRFSSGQTFSNVFSILRSMKAEGYDERVSRNGGSADYTMISADANAWSASVEWRYDGRPSGKGREEFRNSQGTFCQLNADDKPTCSAYMEGSGLSYNPQLWGVPPKSLAQGMSWNVDLKQVWELGGPNGTEKVTVISVDPHTDTAILLREGISEGFFAESDAHTVQLNRDGQSEAFDIKPGTSRWKGYATFVKGVVFSDELVVTRDDTLIGKDGRVVKATERRVMLLNAAPFPTL